MRARAGKQLQKCYGGSQEVGKTMTRSAGINTGARGGECEGEQGEQRAEGRKARESLRIRIHITKTSQKTYRKWYAEH